MHQDRAVLLVVSFGQPKPLERTQVAQPRRKILLLIIYQSSVNSPCSSDPAQEFPVRQSLHLDVCFLIEETAELLVEPLLEARELGVAPWEGDVGQQLRPHLLLALQHGVVDQLGETAGLLAGKGGLKQQHQTLWTLSTLSYQRNCRHF